MTEFIPYILPVVFFFITLLIILSDRKDRKISNVKRLVDDAKLEVDDKMKAFRSQLIDLETSFNQQESHAKTLIQTISSQLRDVQTYSDDLGRVRVAMKTYENSLGALAKLTEDADKACAEVKSNAELLDKFNERVTQLRDDFDSLIAKLTAYEEKTVSNIKETSTAASEEMHRVLEQLKQEESQTADDFKTSADECINENIKNLDYTMKKAEESVAECVEKINSRIQALDETVRTFDSSALHLLNDMGDKSYNQVKLNAELEALTAQREKLAVQLESLNLQIAERQSENREIEEVTRQETNRLSDIKSNIRQLEEQRRLESLTVKYVETKDEEVKEIEAEEPDEEPEELETEVSEEEIQEVAEALEAQENDIEDSSDIEEDDQNDQDDPQEEFSEFNENPEEDAVENDAPEEEEKRKVEYTGEEEQIIFN